MRLQASRVSVAEITIIPFRREALEYPALRDAPIYYVALILWKQAFIRGLKGCGRTA